MSPVADSSTASDPRPYTVILPVEGSPQSPPGLPCRFADPASSSGQALSVGTMPAARAMALRPAAQSIGLEYPSPLWRYRGACSSLAKDVLVCLRAPSLVVRPGLSAALQVLRAGGCQQSFDEGLSLAFGHSLDRFDHDPRIDLYLQAVRPVPRPSAAPCRRLCGASRCPAVRCHWDAVSSSADKLPSPRMQVTFFTCSPPRNRARKAQERRAPLGHRGRRRLGARRGLIVSAGQALGTTSTAYCAPGLTHATRHAVTILDLCPRHQE